MGSKKHPILNDYGPYYRTPRQILDALDDAGEELNYSNYHNGLFDMAKKIIRAWAKAEGVPIGPTKKALEAKAIRKHEKKMAELQAILDSVRPAHRGLCQNFGHCYCGDMESQLICSNWRPVK